MCQACELKQQQIHQIIFGFQKLHGAFRSKVGLGTSFLQRLLTLLCRILLLGGVCGRISRVHSGIVCGLLKMHVIQMLSDKSDLSLILLWEVRGIFTEEGAVQVSFEGLQRTWAGEKEHFSRGMGALT